MLLILVASSFCAAVALCPVPFRETPEMGQASAISLADDPFIGKWKLDPAKSKTSDEMKVASAGENKYTFDLGGGNLETIVSDGTDQPGEFGTTLSVSVEGPNSWRVIRKIGGRTAIDATWELSANGNTLTDHFGSVQPDGSLKRRDYIYKRTAAGAGFAGTWEDTTPPQALEFEIDSYEGDGLSFISVAQKTTKSLKFDGKDYPVQGSNLPAGYVSSGHRVNARSLQLDEKIGGKSLNTQEIEVSPDLKMLTMTVRPQGQGRPRIYVFERE